MKHAFYSISSSIMQFFFLGMLLSVVFIAFSPQLYFLRSRGIGFYAMLSNSMGPQIQTGSLLYVLHQDPATYQVGDVITFAPNASLLSTTHRIASLYKDTKSGEYIFHTKGDANADIDIGEVKGSQIFGKVIRVIPYLGYIVLSVRHPLGFALLILLPVSILICCEGVALSKYVLQLEKEV